MAQTSFMSNSLSILYRDEHFVAVNKPSGLLVHRSAIDRHETRFALQLVRDQLGQAVYPIHRLDKPTSGVLLFGLSAECARKTSELWSAKAIKTYLAIVRGYAPAEGLVNHPLTEERDACSDKKARINKPAQDAITSFKCLATIELPIPVDKYPKSRYALVCCQPRTGRKHQIRRHMKHIQHPIIGDVKHGKGTHNRFFQEHFNAHRLLLAATQLELPHPYTDEKLVIDAPVDKVFHRLLREFNWISAIPSNWINTSGIDT